MDPVKKSVPNSTIDLQQAAHYEVGITKTGHRFLKNAEGKEVGVINNLVNVLHKNVSSASKTLNIKQYDVIYKKINDEFLNKKPDKNTLKAYLHAVWSFINDPLDKRSKKLDQMNNKLSELAHQQQEKLNAKGDEALTKASLIKEKLQALGREEITAKYGIFTMDSKEILKGSQAFFERTKQPNLKESEVEENIAELKDLQQTSQDLVKKKEDQVKNAEKLMEELRAQYDEVASLQKQSQNEMGARGKEYSNLEATLGRLGKLLEEAEADLKSVQNQAQTIQQDADQVNKMLSEAEAVIPKRIQNIKSQLINATRLANRARVENFKEEGLAHMQEAEKVFNQAEKDMSLLNPREELTASLEGARKGYDKAISDVAKQKAESFHLKLTNANEKNPGIIVFGQAIEYKLVSNDLNGPVFKRNSSVTDPVVKGVIAQMEKNITQSNRAIIQGLEVRLQRGDLI